MRKLIVSLLLLNLVVSNALADSTDFDSVETHPDSDFGDSVSLRAYDESGGAAFVVETDGDVTVGVTSADTFTVTATTTLGATTLGATSITDANLTIKDNLDTTKLLQFQLSGITTATTRTLTVPNASDTLVGLATTDTLTNKTLASATNTVSADTMTVIDGTDATSFVGIFDSATGDLAVKTDAGLLYAADTGTLDATVLTEGANPIYNGTETPGGELGGTFASFTVDDSITVTGWVMGASTATTPSADDDDTSLATTAYVQTEINAAGGRSLTATAGSIAVDAELYTDTKCIWFENPTGVDDFKSVALNDSATGYTITKLWCESDQTVTCMPQIDDGSAADMDSVDLVCVSTPDTDTSLDGDAVWGAGDRIDLDVASVAGTPTWVSICWTYTKDD